MEQLLGMMMKAFEWDACRKAGAEKREPLTLFHPRWDSSSNGVTRYFIFGTAIVWNSFVELTHHFAPLINNTHFFSCKQIFIMAIVSPHLVNHPGVVG